MKNGGKNKSVAFIILVSVFVLFNAFEKFCFPQCITDMSRVYFSSVNVRKSCKYINFAVKNGLKRVDERCCAHAR